MKLVHFIVSMGIVFLSNVIAYHLPPNVVQLFLSVGWIFAYRSFYDAVTCIKEKNK